MHAEEGRAAEACQQQDSCEARTEVVRSTGHSAQGGPASCFSMGRGQPCCLPFHSIHSKHEENVTIRICKEFLKTVGSP
jgi:hypothetical protein